MSLRQVRAATSRLEWKDHPPQEEGYYWCRIDGREVELAYVFGAPPKMQTRVRTISPKYLQYLRSLEYHHTKLNVPPDWQFYKEETDERS